LKRNLALGQNRVCANRELLFALPTLEAALLLKTVNAVIPTMRATDSARPTRIDDVLFASVLVRESLDELWERDGVFHGWW
jgi:hypothetical protein